MKFFDPRLTSVIIFALLFLIHNSLPAQYKSNSVLIKSDTTDKYSVVNDTLGIRSGKIKLSDERTAKSGNLAMLLSAIVPGAGQVYAHRYYTIPLIWGFGGYFASIAIKANGHYQDYRGQFAESVRLDTINHTGNAHLMRNRDIYRNYRDEFIVYMALTYFLNIIDAYVGATLYNFDVSDELGKSVAVRFEVPLH
jgi:hypothetical protein